ncbi:xylulose kinase [Prauserella marina]|uniref:Xylulokinase n=1 Tax=Prauserella marina TaxID=530584 RepID=A0A222VNQ0_9PSEU|nr:FGGY-family carbohydrate kinase [Prauserella marina]ASR35537.1 xylulose kinase [Prauserella marina]PWV84623.1 xylulokinase [Prauserella marina]SDC17423.1 xylulokinase [Prauserella marina]
MSTHVIAVDVGTSAVRAVSIDAGGAVAASTHIRRTSGVGGETFDAAALYREVTGALAGVAGGPAPSALAIAAHIGTVAVGADLEPVDVGGGWADARGTETLAAVGEATMRDILRASGRPAPTGGALAYLLGLDRERASSVRAVLSPKDFLVARLTGVLAADTVDAAYTLASDVRARTWNTAVLDRLGIATSVLPPQTEPASVVAELSAEAAAATGLPEGLPVVAGGPDGSVGIGLLLGTGEGVIADVAGTTDVMGRLLPSGAEAPEGAVLNPALLEERLVAGGASGLTGGAVARWRGLVGTVADDRLVAVPPGSEGLLLVPTMTGARFPRWRRDSRGALLGQRPEHEPAHLVRAAQEAAAFTVREGLDLLDPSGRLPVVLAGGAVRSAQVARLRADVFDRPVLLSPEPDVTLLGAAALALVGCAAVADLDTARSRLIGRLREIEPDGTRSERYARLYTRWREVRDVVEACQVDP